MYVRKRCYFNWFWAKGNICSILCVCVSIGKRDRREKYIQWEISLLEGPSHSEFGLVTHCAVAWPFLRCQQQVFLSLANRRWEVHYLQLISAPLVDWQLSRWQCCWIDISNRGRCHDVRHQLSPNGTEGGVCHLMVSAAGKWCTILLPHLTFVVLDGSSCTSLRLYPGIRPGRRRALPSAYVCRNSTTLWVSGKLMVFDGSLHRLPCCLGANQFPLRRLHDMVSLIVQCWHCSLTL